METSIVQLIAVYALPLVLGITLHEAAHAWAAAQLGDRTAQMQGRVTANPLKHIDPVGTLLVPGLLLLASRLGGAGAGFFGWAKPVPVIWSNLGSPHRDMGLVAAAGPLANVLMALGWALLYKLGQLSGTGEEFVFLVAMAGISVNLTLAVLNLLPVLPLDGRAHPGVLAAAPGCHRLVAPGTLRHDDPDRPDVYRPALGHRQSPGRWGHAPHRRTAPLLKVLPMFPERVVSGMRPTGALHLGHYHGALKNWVRLQAEYPCFFFVADFHALTTHYDSPNVIGDNVWEMVIDWLAAGIDPQQSTLFLQSRVPEHAELHLLLSMCTPLGWLERVPTYKDQQEKLSDRDLATYGFLGYPLLQAADILLYRAAFVPVGEDQVPHIELTREVSRRFNHLFGKEPGFEDNAKQAIKKLGSKRAKLYSELRARYQEQGDEEALAQGSRAARGLAEPEPGRS